ncbi:hypothetical protein F5Y16DRAFT_136863 [Xylariaceae sp. FL0255]|nr:hypothetical protein F5Y16DRAFT_136863 [Xylariaceae sp. FL0255]
MTTSREERMQQRMRGAGRHEVGDDSFGFILPPAEASSDPPSSAAPVRSEPNTSAKRRRLDNEPPSSIRSNATRTSPRLGGGQPTLNIIHEEKEIPPADPVQTDTAPANPISSATRSSDPYTLEDTDQDASKESLPEPSATVESESREELLEALPVDAPRPASRASLTSPTSRDPTGNTTEEVTESPAAAPGSGKRRSVRTNNVGTQSAKLQKMVMEAEAAGSTGEITTSSPLVRKTRQSETTLAATSARTTRSNLRRQVSSPIEAPQDSSPLAHASRRVSNSTAGSGSVRSTRSQTHRSPLGIAVDEINELSSPPDAVSTSSARMLQRKTKQPRKKQPPKAVPEFPDMAETDEEEDEQPQAEEIDDVEAAQKIGRKRPRISSRQKERPEEEEQEESPQIEGAAPPTKKSRTRRVQDSPAKQSHPKKPSKEKKKRRSSERQGNGESIPVTVQRYTRPLERNGENSDEDILNDDIPFTDHKSPNVVDILLQLCEESMEKYLSAVHEKANEVEGRYQRREFRTKIRSLEAFQEEIRIRLQTHTIALDNLRTLNKRVRAAQKEKVALRNEILRIRAEREQVALKMDAVRTRHETANKESLYQLSLSSAMDDIELAIGNGKTAPDLSMTNARERKMAELANLDLLVAQVTSQVTAAGDGGGGTLRQIREFNAFLERAAVALEAR